MKKDYRTTLALANPWGTTPADTGTVLRFRWAGREYDQETGLYYMRARYYDPQLGKFLSEDPIGVEGGLNLYGYVGNDPANRTDPFGEEMVCWSERIWMDGPATGTGNIHEMSVNGGGEWSMKWHCSDDGVIPGGGGQQTAGTPGPGGQPGQVRDGRTKDPAKCRDALLVAGVSVALNAPVIGGFAYFAKNLLHARALAATPGMMDISRAFARGAWTSMRDGLVPSMSGFMLGADATILTGMMTDAQPGLLRYLVGFVPVFGAGFDIVDAIAACRPN
jgi:RHS repeat-associated protein